MDRQASWWRSRRNRLLACIGGGLVAGAVVIGAMASGWWSPTSNSEEACDATVYEGCPGRWDYLIDSPDQ